MKHQGRFPDRVYQAHYSLSAQHRFKVAAVDSRRSKSGCHVLNRLLRNYL